MVAVAEFPFPQLSEHGIRAGELVERALELVPDDQLPGGFSQYLAGDPATIRVAVSRLHDQENLIASMVRELAHEILFRNGHLKGDELDGEWITDLLTVFLGMGIVGANTAVQQHNFQDGLNASWRIERHGYLPARLFGYAMALFSVVRCEERPPWAKMLCADAATVFRGDEHT